MKIVETDKVSTISRFFPTRSLPPEKKRQVQREEISVEKDERMMRMECLNQACFMRNLIHSNQGLGYLNQVIQQRHNLLFRHRRG